MREALAVGCDEAVLAVVPFLTSARPMASRCGALNTARPKVENPEGSAASGGRWPAAVLYPGRGPALASSTR
nr:hypothetical protein [Eubacterium maltosivorans]